MDRQHFRPANQLASDRRKKIRRAAGFPCKKYQLVTFCYFGTEFQRKVPKCSSSWRGAQTFMWWKKETCVRWCFWALSSQNQHSTHVSIFERFFQSSSLLAGTPVHGLLGDCFITFNPFFPTDAKIWKTPYFVSTSPIELIIDQWISVGSTWSLDSGKAKSKNYSYDGTIYSLEILLVAPIVLS